MLGGGTVGGRRRHEDRIIACASQRPTDRGTANRNQRQIGAAGRQLRLLGDRSTSTKDPENRQERRQPDVSSTCHHLALFLLREVVIFVLLEIIFVVIELTP